MIEKNVKVRRMLRKRPTDWRHCVKREKIRGKKSKKIKTIKLNKIRTIRKRKMKKMR